MLLDDSGKLFGTTSGVGNRGTVFELSTVSPGHGLQTLYGFHGGADGSRPGSGVIMGAKGALFGTTTYGGDSETNCGTFFELVPSSSGYTKTTLHDFSGEPDGCFPAEA